MTECKLKTRELKACFTLYSQYCSWFPLIRFFLLWFLLLWFPCLPGSLAPGSFSTGGQAGMAQWWEHLPLTNVARVRLQFPVSYVGCWFSSLLWEVFLQVLQFSLLLKNQPFQIPIRSGAHEHVLMSFWASKCFAGKQITFTFFYWFPLPWPPGVPWSSWYASQIWQRK